MGSGCGAAGAAAGGGAAPFSEAPHSLQNRPPAAGVPHCGQAAAMGWPHSLQNFAPEALAVPHPAHNCSATRER
jgi:hypothetical protein